MLSLILIHWGWKPNADALPDMKAGCKKFRPKASLRAHGRKLSDNSTFDVDLIAQDHLIRNETARNCGDLCLWGVS